MASKKAYVEHLRNVPLFSGCTTKDLEKIARAGDEVRMPAGSLLTDQGQTGREAFIVLDGTVKVVRMVAAHDVGRAINPTQVEGQIHGGIAQGLGLALMEEYLPGRTENLHDYLIPTFGDVPPIEVIFVEDPEPLGPYGAKGIGEPALIPTAPAIFGGIHHATGVRMHFAPATPHRVREALLKAGVCK